VIWLPCQHSIAKLAKHIDRVLGKYEFANPKLETQILYRSTRDRTQKFNSVLEARQFLSEKYKVGGILEVQGYMSTTTNPEALFDFMSETYDDTNYKNQRPNSSQEKYIELLGEDDGLGNVVYEIETTSGVPMSAFGQFYAAKEQEYLLPRNKKFRVIEVTPHVLLHNPNTNAQVNAVRHATIVRLQEIKTN
jgi:hypothetical protein